MNIINPVLAKDAVYILAILPPYETKILKNHVLAIRRQTFSTLPADTERVLEYFISRSE
jgi:hypothetical protein